MAATVGTQAVPSTGSSMLVQLLESQRLENNVEVLAEGEETTEEVTQHQRPEGENVDVTDWIVNPGFDDGTTNGWEYTGTLPVIVDGRAESISNPWNKYTFDFYQDIQVPNGLYSVSVQEHATIGGRANLYIQGYDRATALMNWNNGDFTQWVDENVSRVTTGNVLVVDDTVRIGVNLHSGHQSQNLHFDNFKLTYVNDGNAEAQNLYNAKIGELRDATTYPVGLQARVDAAKAEKTVTTDNFLAEYTALDAEVALLNSSAVSDFMELVASYSSIAANLDETAQGAITAAIAAANKALVTVESVDGVAQISDNLTAAFREAAGDQEYVVAEFNFDDGRTDGWSGATGNMAQAGVMEFYNQNFDFWYQLRDLESGWYQVEVNAFYRSSSLEDHQARLDKNLAVIFGDDNGSGRRYSMPALSLYDEDCTEVGGMGNAGAYPNDRTQANSCFQAGHYKMTVNAYVGADGILNFGLAGTNQGYSWICFDNFKVTYKGNDLSAMYDAMQVQAVALAEKYGMTAYAENLNGLTKPETVDEAAIWNMNEQTKAIIDIANAMVDFPANLETYKSGIEEALANSEASEEDKGFYTDLQNLNLANVMSLEDMDVEGAYHNYLSVANPTGDYQFDMTWLLTNPKSTGATTGWYCNVMGGDAGRENTNVGWSTSASYRGDADVAGFIEKWSTNIMSPGEDGNGWLLYQQALLPAGAYKLTALAFTDMPFNATTTGDNPVTGEAVANLSMGFGSTVKVDGEAFDWQEHEKYTGEVPAAENKNQLKLMTIPYFYLGEAATEENPVKLGINIKEGNKADWFGINDMKLYKVAPQAVNLTLDETSTSYSVEPNAYANVTLTRTLKSDAWNTFCVPFDMTAEQLAANGITDVRALESASVEGTSVTLNFSESNLNAVEAGVPYLVKVDAIYDGTINVENVLVSAAEPTTVSVEGGVSMTGNYAAGNVPTGAYFISDNAFYYADVETVVLKGFRAYINVNGTSEAAGANRLMINLDGEVTGIEDVLGEEAAEADKLVNVVSLDGMTVKAGVKKAEALDGLQKGIYIVDGKKYVVK